MANINQELDTSLTIYNILELHKKYSEVLIYAEKIEMDLSNITDCDTSGIQLLYSLKKSCMDKGKEISIKNPSAAVHEALNRISTSWEIFS